MDKHILSELVEQGLSQREIGQNIGLSHTATRYWLNRHELVTNKVHNCRKCGESNKDKFLAGRWTECRKCRSEEQSGRFRDYKKKSIEYKGGKCCKCGYDKCQAGLDFHHLNPENKDPRWKTMRSWTFEKIKNELDKCILVCRNCHAEIHYGV